MWIKKIKGIYHVGWREDGKEKYRSLRTKQKQIANERFRSFKPGGDSELKLDDLKREGIRHSGTHFKKERVYQYRAAMNNLIEYLGNKKLKHITKKDLEDYKTWRTTRKCKGKRSLPKPRTVDMELSVFKVLFKIAEENDWILRNPVKKVKLFNEKTETIIITEEHLQRIFESIKREDIKDLCELSLVTSCRLTELCELTKEQINFKDMMLKLYNKMDKNVEYIPLNKRAFEILEKWVNKINVIDLRLRSSNIWGIEIKPHTVSQYFRRTIRKLGLPRAYHFHCLRHTVLTSLARTEPLAAVQKLARHKNINTTMKYIHIPDNDTREAAEKIMFKIS